MPQHRPIPFQLTTGAERGRISLYGKVRRQTASGARAVSADLGAGLSARLETVVAQLLPGPERESPLCLFNTLMLACIHRLNGNSSYTIGNQPASQAAQHGFPAFSPVQIEMDEDETFATLVRKVSRAVSAAQACCPAEYCDVLVFYSDSGTPDGALQQERDADTIALHVLRNGATGSFGLRLELPDAIFTGAEAERALRDLLRTAEAFAEDSEQRLARISFFSGDDEKETLLRWGTGATRPIDGRGVHEIFESQAASCPDNIAVFQAGERMSYADLNHRANRLARYLRQRGVTPGTNVGVHLSRSPEMVSAILGVLKAGGAYVPLDPRYPNDWLAYVLKDAGASIVVTNSTLAGELRESGTEMVCLDLAADAIALESDANLNAAVQGEAVAFLVYTSGSTGMPKGVEITHRALTNYVTHTGELFGLTHEDRLLQFASISFDTAVEEIFCALTHGATLVLRTDTLLDSMSRFLETCAAWGITVLDLPTAYWHEMTARMCSDALALPESVRVVVIGGERAIPERLSAWRACVGERVRFFNSYGPSEATIAVTVCEMRAPDDRFGEVPIGRPIPNVRLYVLDDDLQLVPIGVPGELFIGGAGLGTYHNRPGLNASKFVADPFCWEPGSRLYRTGDLVRYRFDGNLEFIRRIDQQVKIRGCRVETEQVEAVLRQNPDIADAVVVARDDLGENARLVAYLVCRRRSHPSAREMHGLLARKLPEYMVPSAFVFVEALPLTPNGKINRRALPAPGAANSAHAEDYAEPRSQLEVQLAMIWESLLDCHPVGVNDNFYEIGGHSLLAARMISRIEKVFRQKLPPGAIVLAPTIAEQAKLLSGGAKATRSSPLFPLQPDGSKLPFFWVHGESSDAFISRYLGPDQPVYGLMHQGLDGTPALHRTVRDIAGYHLREIRRIQAHGPYLLGGYCFGGLVALEMARQLQDAGEEPGLVFMLEPINPRIFGASPGGSASAADRAASWKRDLARHRRNLSGLSAERKARYLAARVIDKLRLAAARAGRPATRAAKRIACLALPWFGAAIPVSLRSFHILDVYDRALNTYVPCLPQCPLVLLSCSEGNEPELWRTLGGGHVEIQQNYPGTHNDVLGDANVRIWAAELKIHLEGAHSTPRSHSAERHTSHVLTADLRRLWSSVHREEVNAAVSPRTDPAFPA